MKKTISIIICLLLCISIAGCEKKTVSDNNNAEVTAAVKSDDKASENKAQADSKDSASTASDVKEPASDPVTDVSADIKSTVAIETEVKDGYSYSDGIYTFSKGGIYRITGEFSEGQLYVDAADEQVELHLAGVKLSSSKNSVIYVENADEVKIKAIDGTVNYVTDNRAQNNASEDEAGSACIYSKDDLKIQGQGTLFVSSSYNNGIQSKNDIKIKNLTLEVTAPNNAIKGNDSITIESGTINVTSTDGDGLKTKNTDISSKGKQRGIIDIIGGTVAITAAKDCLDAAYDVQISEDAKVFTNK